MAQTIRCLAEKHGQRGQHGQHELRCCKTGQNERPCHETGDPCRQSPLSTIREAGSDNIAVVLQGHLITGEVIAEAGLTAQPKIAKPAQTHATRTSIPALPVILQGCAPAAGRLW
jgi:hypothetical protein